MHRVTGDPSVGDLFADLSRQISTLVRQEVRLASLEMKGKVSGLGKEIGMVVAGGALAYAGLLALLAGLVFLLDLFMPTWAAALLVGLLVVGGGYALVRSGLNGLKQVDLAPRTTLRTIRDDVAAVRHQEAA